MTDTRLYGAATARSWDRLHPRLTHRNAWIDQTGDLPLIEGTVIRLEVNHLPSGAIPKPVWLWWSETDATPADVDRLWQAFLRRFDIEHTFRLLKQTLGWTCPKIRTPQAADRWTWLILAVYAQLRLARGLTSDLRRPGRNRHRPNASHPPASDEGSGTSARRPPAWPARRNPPDQVQGDHQADRTSNPLNDTTCTSARTQGRNRRPRAVPAHAAQVKDQA